MNSYQRYRVGRRLVLLGVLVVVLAATALVLLAAGAAGAAGDGTVTAGWAPGDRCTAGSANRVRQGRTYACVQKAWDDCPRWHHVKPADYTPPADWTRPPQRPCAPACTPTPTPAATPPSSAPAAPPAAATPAALPVTGVPVLPIVVVGAALVAAGATLRFYRRSE